MRICGQWLSARSFVSPQRPIPMGARICRRRVRCEYTTSRTFCSPTSRHRAQFETYAAILASKLTASTFLRGGATGSEVGLPFIRPAIRSTRLWPALSGANLEATPVLSPAYMFIAGVTEESLRAAYTRRYGVVPIAELERPS